MRIPIDGLPDDLDHGPVSSEREVTLSDGHAEAERVHDPVGPPSNGPEGRLPTFIIIGAMRSGTTSLVRYLERHPEVHMGSTKEIHFFDQNFHRGLSWYRSHFEGAEAGQAVGEATPIYMFDSRVPERMSSVLPDAKLIAVLRNPVDRAYSHYWQKRSYGKESLSFEDAIEAEPDRIRQSAEGRSLYSYIERGRYLKQLRRFAEHYPREALFLSLFEDLRDRPREIFARICRFIGVDDSFVPENLGSRINRYTEFRSTWLRGLTRRLPKPLKKATGWANSKRSSYPDMDPAVRSELLDRFRRDNEELAAWSGLDLSAWEA